MNQKWLQKLPATAIGALITFAATVCAAAPPQADLAGFERTVQPLLQKFCVDCHSTDDPSGGLDLQTIDANLLSGRAADKWRTIRFQLHFREMPPKDAEPLKDADRQKLHDWITQELHKLHQPGITVDEKLLLPEFGNDVDHKALFSSPAGVVQPTTPRIWRARPGVYRGVIEQAATTSNISKKLATPFALRGGEGLQDFAAGYFIDEPTTNLLLGNAETLIDFQIQSGGRFRDLIAVAGPDANPSAEDIKWAIAYQFRAILHRGPTAEETGRFAAFYKKVAKEGGNELAGKTMLTAIVMQPEALFRQELGEGPVDEHGRQRLSQTEIAFALSYALDDRVDGEVLKLVDEKKLATKDDVAAYVAERLREPGKRKNGRILQFFREYFGYPAIEEVFKDRPELGIHEPKFLLADLELLIEETLNRDKQVLRELLTTNRYYILARRPGSNSKNFGKVEFEPTWGNKRPLEYQTVYGLPVDWKWTQQQPVELPADERVGVLSHPAWLVAWSGNFDNHPVQRGRWIRTRLLGGFVPDVPIGVDARIPEGDTPLRHRLAAVTGATECWRCHKLMDNLGLPFEQFDHFGRFRRFEQEQPVDTRGEIAYTDDKTLNGEVTNHVELIHQLAKSEYVEQMFVRYAFRYFMGRNETLGDAGTLQNAWKAYRNNDGSFRALVVSLLSSDSFLYRQASKHPRMQ